MTPGAVATPPRPGRLRARMRPRHQAGEAAAFATLYERHQLELYRYCRSIVRHDEDARDAVQSTMTKAFAALQTEGRDIELRPWLFRIAHNEAISLLRRRPDTAELHEDVGGAQDTLHETVETRDRLANLREDLQDLPERQRAALVMRELSGMGHEEIAAALDTSARAIKQTIYEARSGLNDCAEGRDMECDAVRRVLSDDDRRVVQSRRIRAHLRSCRGCRTFKAALVQRPKDLAALSPVVPLTALGVFSAGGLGGGAAGAGAVGGGAAAGAAAGSAALAVGGGSGLVLAAAAKVAAVVAATATVAGGVIAVADPGPSGGGRSPAAQVAAGSPGAGAPAGGPAAGAGAERHLAAGGPGGFGVRDPLAGALTGRSTAFGTTLRADGPDGADRRGRAARDAAQRRRAAREAARARDAGGGGAARAREDRTADAPGRDASGRGTTDATRSAAARARGAERRAAASGGAGRSDGAGSTAARARTGGSGSGSGTKTTGRPPAATPAPQSSSRGQSPRSSPGGSGASGGSAKGTGTTGTKRSGGAAGSGAAAPGVAKASGTKSAGAAGAGGRDQSAGSGAAKATGPSAGG